MSSFDEPLIERAPEQEISIQELWASLRRGRWLLLGVIAATVAVVMAVTLLTPPVYESEAVLRIRSDRATADLLPDLGAFGGLGLPGLGGDEIDTEMGILRSRRIATAVADSLNLHLQLQRPDRPRANVLALHSVDQSAVPGEYTLRLQSDGSYSVGVDGAEGPVGGPDRVVIGETFNIGNMRLSLVPDLRANPPRTISFLVVPATRAIAETRERLKVDRQAIGSKLVQVRYRDGDPETAAAVVNQAVQQYVAYRGRTESSDSRHTMEVLRDQVSQYESELRDAEERLRQFQEQERIVAPEEQATQQVRRIAEIQARHDAVTVEREALSDLLEQVRRRSGTDSGVAAYRQLATFPAFISSGAVQDILVNLIELENQRAGLLARRTEDNADVQVVTARIEELENQLYRVGTNYLGSLETQRRASANALASFGRELEAIPAKEVEYARRVRDQRLLSEIYLMLQTRLKEAELKEAIDSEDVRVVDDAIVPEDPVLPKPFVNLVLAVVLGLMLGVSLILFRDVMGTSIRSVADAENAADGIPVLGTIPPHRQASRARRDRLPFRWMSRMRPGQNGASGEALVTRLDPWAPASDAYRALAGALLAGPETPKVLMITSPGPQDGKEEIAANLAVTLAQRGSRTLLIGADLRSSDLNSLLDTPAAPGLSSLLMEEIDLEGAVRKMSTGETGGGELDLLSSDGRAGDNGQLLSSEKLVTLVGQLRGRYSHIVVEAPPVSGGADAAAIGKLSDATLLVVKDGHTERRALQGATRLLRRAGVPVAGVALNASSTSMNGHRRPRPAGAGATRETARTADRDR